ncbi:MAG: ribose transport system substrate-binding protein [Thermoleophilales bacterium]|jgi:ribose transport system substrate-binding protein|nr:ribose transport system substrate-binding protein [Thermoleophilales bacterium]
MTRGKVRAAAIAVSAVVAAGTITACGSDNSGGGGSGGGSGDKGTIGVSVPTVQGPFFTAMLYGIKDEAKKMGYKVQVMDAGGYANVDQQATQMNNLTTQQVKAILVDPADPTVIKAPVAQAKSANIPVIGTGDPAPDANSNVSSSHCDIGKAMAAGTQKLLPQGGDIAVLAGPPGATWTTDRLKCFKEVLKGSNISIKAEKTSEPAVDQGVTIASDFLQRYPALDLLYGADDTVGVGAANAVKEANRCGKTKVLLAVLGEQAESLLKEGCVNYVVAQQTVLIGRQAVQTADKLIQGQTVEQNIAVPLVDVTQDNVGSVDISTMREPAGYKP